MTGLTRAVPACGRAPLLPWVVIDEDQHAPRPAARPELLAQWAGNDLDRVGCDIRQYDGTRFLRPCSLNSAGWTSEIPHRNPRAWGSDSVTVDDFQAGHFARCTAVQPGVLSGERITTLSFSSKSLKVWGSLQVLCLSRHNPRMPWEVEFYRAEDENPVVEELLALRRKNVDLAAELVADLQDLERFGLALPRTRLHKVRGTKDLWALRTEYAGNIARSIFFETGNRRCIVLAVFEKKTDDLPRAAIKRAQRRMATWDRTRHQ